MTGPCADETKGWRLACVAAGVAGQSPACLDGHLAALLAGKRSDGLCIGVAGGSGSGKTTIAQRLRDSILPLPAEIIGLDRFFKPIDQMPRYFSAHHAEHRPDFNTPQSLRVDEMLAFARQVAGQGIVILDGHFALYFPQMRELMHIKVFVDIGLAAMPDDPGL
jgi:uridine kinase